VYPLPETGDRVRRELRARLPADVLVLDSAQAFRPGSLSARRVGPILLVATGNRFCVQPDYEYEHGSWSAPESVVPFAEWHPS
jgi:hypothetical protein